MRILVTGATGFVGKNLIPKLIEKHEVYEITIEPDISKKLYNNNVQSFHFNNNQHELISFLKKNKPEIIIHLASFLTSSDEFGDAEKLINANVKFLINILDACKYHQPKLFVNTGSFAEYLHNDGKFDPAYLYAATKTASRSFLQYYSGAYNFKFITMVPYSIYGPNDSQKKLMDYLIESIENPIDFTLGEQILDFIHVDDVVKCYLDVIENHKDFTNNETIFVGTGIGTSIKELAKIIEETLGKELKVNWGAKPYRKRDVMIAFAPINKNKIKLTFTKNLKNYFNK